MELFFEFYDVTKDGRVFRKSNGIELIGCIDSFGYKIISGCMNGIKKNFKLHRLVAFKYIENPNNYNQVNHIDGNKINNCVENLEWCSAQHNIRHAHDTGLADNAHLKKPILKIDKDTDIVLCEYDSIREASIDNNIHETNISSVCSCRKPKNRPHPRVTAGGFKWKWKTCND